MLMKRPPAERARVLGSWAAAELVKGRDRRPWNRKTSDTLLFITVQG